MGNELSKHEDNGSYLTTEQTNQIINLIQRVYTRVTNVENKIRKQF